MVLHSNQGRNFESLVIRELCTLLGMKKARTTPYHPQCDGLVERLNRTLLNLLAKHVSEKQRDWDDCLATVLFAYRNAKHSWTEETPFSLMFGRKPRHTVNLMLESREPPPLISSDYVSALREAQLVAQEKVAESIAVAQDRQSSQYDEKVQVRYEHQPRDLVWLYTPAVKKRVDQEIE